MTDLFSGPEMKIARAKRHVGELALESTAFLARRPFAVIVEEPPDAPAYLQCHVWKVHVRQQMPNKLPACVGDAVHNLRSALDLMACDLARHNGRSATSVYFPFAVDAVELEKEIKKRNLHRINPDALALVRSLKPYRGGNVDLRALHDLDVHDKHKGPIALINAVTTPSFALKLGNRVNPIPSWNSAIKDGLWLMMMPACDNIPLGTEIPALYRFAFSNNTPFPGHEVVPTLHRLTEHVAGIVEAFKTLCLGDEGGRAA
jgi:hypothetical protein